MHQKFGIPFLPMKRPKWDTFPGAVYTIGSDVIMPDGKLLQQPSTHFLGQSFSKAFDVSFLDENEKKQNVWQTCYGPAISRIMASVISTHGDDKGLVLPYCISPVQVVIVPIFKKENKKKIIEKAEKIKKELEKEDISSEIDDSEKRPGEKFYNWELKGVPLRIELGEKELASEKIMLYIRDLNEKREIKNLSEIKKIGAEIDERIRKKAEKNVENNIISCNDKRELKRIIEDKKIARVNFCSMEKEGVKCAEVIEKEINADVRGTLANKNEDVFGECIICKKKASVVAYIGRSY
jgi:prolyl-tRNA synthetase